MASVTYTTALISKPRLTSAVLQPRPRIEIEGHTATAPGTVKSVVNVS
jgi:hypothetical protein